MRLVKGKWVKYSNKFVPRYFGKHWEVHIGGNKYVGFYNWERAKIYEEIIKLKGKFAKEINDGEKGK